MKKIIFAFICFCLGILTYLVIEHVFPKNIISSHISKFEIDTDIVLEDVNNFRLKNDLNSLVKNENLCNVAKVRLKEIPFNWSHNGFSAARFCAVNCMMGENLAKNYKTEQSIIDAWENSPEHKAVMINKDLKYGCVASDGKYTVLEASTMIPY